MSIKLGAANDIGPEFVDAMSKFRGTPYREIIAHSDDILSGLSEEIKANPAASSAAISAVAGAYVQEAFGVIHMLCTLSGEDDRTASDMADNFLQSTGAAVYKSFLQPRDN